MHEPSASAGRSRYNQQHRKASRVAGKMTLPQFLEGYERIKLGDACRAAPIRSGDLAVWVNSTGVWTQVDAQTLWGRRGNESLCRTLVVRLLGMSQAQYNSMKDALEDDKEIGERITPVIDRVGAGYSEIKEHSSNWHNEGIKMRVDDLSRYFQLENGDTLEDET